MAPAGKEEVEEEGEEAGEEEEEEEAGICQLYQGREKARRCHLPASVPR